MGIFAPEAPSFEIPAEGPAQAVCADVIDLGVVPGFEGKPTHKIEVVFQVDQNGADGKPLQVKQRFSLSSHEKSTLRVFLENWRGKKFRDAREMAEVDLSALVGANAMINIVHAAGSQGGKFANIGSIMQPAKNAAKMVVSEYVRREPRKANQKAGAPKAPAVDLSSKDLPF